MNFGIISILFVLYVSFVLGSRDNFVIEQSVSDETVILGEIITNYLIKYFSDAQIFVSFILAPSQNNQMDGLEEDFFENLFDDPILTKFACNILDKLDMAIHDHRNAFHMILIDDSKSLA